MAYTVYCHTNKVNGKKYFGITRQRCKTRWQGGNGYSSNPYFSAAIKKYGWDGFTHEIIAQGVSKQEACELEQYLIRTHDTTNRSKGYNISIGGEFGNLGRKYSDAEKAKMSERTKKLWDDEEYRRKNLKSRKGYVYTEEHRKHLSEALKGHRFSEEQKKKIGEAIRKSEKFKANRKTWNKGIKYTKEQRLRYKKSWEYTSDEARKKISDSVKQLWTDESYRKHMSEAHIGKNTKKVLCVELNRVFESMQEAQKVTSVKYYGISNCCHGKAKTAGGYHWQFAE